MFLYLRLVFIIKPSHVMSQQTIQFMICIGWDRRNKTKLTCMTKWLGI